MRNKIFISHANPEDNDQARWLGLQLMTLGYEVWCDVFNLKGGEKFWKEIENEIRNNTCKFLYVLTKNSNQREGCLDELAVAEAVEKTIEDNRFIIALHYDQDLTYDELNIRLKRRIDLNFKTDWQQGLKNLLAVFEEEPKVVISENPDFEHIRKYWSTIYLNDRKPVEKEETYTSNWFPISRLPDILYVHDFKGLIKKGFEWESLPFPTIGYKKHTVTFAPAPDFIPFIPGVENYNIDLSKKYIVDEILQNNYEDTNIKNRTLVNCINFLIKTGFVKTLKAKGLLSYEMSGTTAFCYSKDMNIDKIFPFGQLVGRLKERNWHFAYSGFPDLGHMVFVIKSHILLSENGEIVDSKRVQQSGRRKQGSNWWNKHWKEKLMSAISIVSDENGLIKINVGRSIAVFIESKPLAFSSYVSYYDPDESREALDDFTDEEDDEGNSEQQTKEHEQSH